MKQLPPTCVTPGDANWPSLLAERLGASAPPQLSALGDLTLLALHKTTLFCSARCPGHAILAAYDQAAKWRDAGRCASAASIRRWKRSVYAFSCAALRPSSFCPARGLPQRLPVDWRKPLSSGRMLLLSNFPAGMTRVTAALAARRNEFVAALADEVWFAHISPGG